MKQAELNGWIKRVEEKIANAQRRTVAARESRDPAEETAPPVQAGEALQDDHSSAATDPPA